MRCSTMMGGDEGEKHRLARYLHGHFTILKIRLLHHFLDIRDIAQGLKP